MKDDVGGGLYVGKDQNAGFTIVAHVCTFMPAAALIHFPITDKRMI